MLQVNLEDVKAHWEQRQLWNKTPLEDIQLMYKGQPVQEVPMYDNNGNQEPLTIDEWKYTGLSNIDYLKIVLAQHDEIFDQSYSYSKATI